MSVTESFSIKQIKNPSAKAVWGTTIYIYIYIDRYTHGERVSIYRPTYLPACLILSWKEVDSISYRHRKQQVPAKQCGKQSSLIKPCPPPAAEYRTAKRRNCVLPPAALEQISSLPILFLSLFFSFSCADALAAVKSPAQQI